MSFTPVDPSPVDEIIETLGAMLQRRTIARELEKLRQFAVVPEQIDELVLAAISASFSLEDENLNAEIPQLGIATTPAKAQAA